MSSKLCKFLVVQGNDCIFYCGLDEGHDDDHLVAFPNKEKD